MILKSARI